MSNLKSNFEFSSDEYMEYCDNYNGICTECGAIADNVEPDAEGYECESCGKHAVQGFEEALMNAVIIITD